MGQGDRIPLLTVDNDLRSLLETLDPKARDDLRRVLIRGQADRDAISSRLMRYLDQNGQGLGGHHRFPDDVSGGAAEGGSTSWRDCCERLGALEQWTDCIARGRR
jgi:hypothetical protein